ncbi:unnamed protein product, partial [Didymodactylos carnosus]
GIDKKGYPLITFPHSAPIERLNPDEIKKIITYLASIASSTNMDPKFSFIVDMRGRTWESGKAIFKALQDGFPYKIEHIYIIKPENFWEKHKISVGMSKYTQLEHTVESVESLTRDIDRNQLPTDLNGTFQYNHQNWLEFRLKLEGFVFYSKETLQKYESNYNELNLSDQSSNVRTAQDAIESHMIIYKDKLSRITIDGLINEGKNLLNMLRIPLSNNVEQQQQDNNASKSNQRAFALDYFDEARKITIVMDNLRSAKDRCYLLWHQKKVRLEQNLQLRLFEQDCDKLCNWIGESRSIILRRYTDIGNSCLEAMQHLAEHEQFTKTCLGNEAVIRRTQNVGERLISSGHYATNAIKTQMNRLNEEWKFLTTLLDNRTKILTASLQFHQKADEYLIQVPTWKHLCSLTDDITSIQSIDQLECLLQQHYRLSDNISKIYADICSDGKAIIDSVAPPQTSDDQLDFRSSARHILEIVQEILSNHRLLDFKWNQRRTYLQQRKSLLTFEYDVQQIFDWLERHGDVFLQKNVSIGRSLHRAKALLKTHSNFETVLENTKTNAEKLIAAADELYREQQEQKQTSVSSSSSPTLTDDILDLELTQAKNKIYQLAHDLDKRMQEFDGKVQKRRQILDINFLFHEHIKQLTTWLEEIQPIWANNDLLVTNGLSIDEIEQMLDKLIEQHDATIDACTTTEQEGQALLDYITEISTMSLTTTHQPCFNHLTELINSIRSKTSELETLWEMRKLRLEFYLQMENFHTSSNEVSQLLEIWSEELLKMNNGSAHIGIPVSLQNLINTTNSNTNTNNHMSVLNKSTKMDNWSQVQEHIHTRVAEVVQRGKDLLNLMEASELKLKFDDISNNNNGDNNTNNKTLSSQDQIRTLINYVNEREKKLQEMATQQQKQSAWRTQMVKLEKEANEISILVNSFEVKLSANLFFASCLAEAEKFNKDREEIQRYFDKILDRIDTIHHKTEKLLSSSTVILAENSNDLDSKSSSSSLLTSPIVFSQHTEQQRQLSLVKLEELIQRLISQRQTIILHRDDRFRLLTVQISFYKSAEQVSSTLDTLDRDYRVDEDLHEKFKTVNDNDVLTLLATRSQKLLDQKHAFLRACTLARRSSEQFHKCAHRNAANAGKSENYLKPIDTKIKNVVSILTAKENNVLIAWHSRKKLLDEYMQYISFKRNANKVLSWIHECGESYLEKHKELSDGREKTEAHSKEHAEFVRALKEKKAYVRKSVDAADTLVEKGHSYAGLIKDMCNQLDYGFNDFFRKIEQIGKEELDKDSRKSDSSLEEKLENQELTEGKKKSAKQRELIFNELLTTERAYVESLNKCIEYYLSEMRRHPDDVPEFLQNKESVLFLNIEEIYNFHKNLFLKDLERYGDSPEDVGHCFVTWAEQFQIFYVEYCKNNESCIKLLSQYRGPYFENIQHKYHTDTINSYLIKPVQRITKYEMLLQRLMACCEESKGEIKEGFDLMCSVPKKANDAMHLGYLEELEPGLTKEALGDVLLQNTFQIWDSKQLIKKGKERHVFLFETSVVIAKIPKLLARGAIRYIYKYKLMTAEICDVKEHLEAGEPCKFALFTGRSSTHDLRVTLKAADINTKQQWIMRIRELIQENALYHDISVHEANVKQQKISVNTNINNNDRRSQEYDNTLDECENISRGGSVSSMTTGSFSSSGQQLNTVDKTE